MPISPQLQLTNRCTPTEEGIQTISDKIMTAPTMFSSRNLTVCHMIVMWLPWDIYNILTNGSCIKIRKQVKQESAKVRIGRDADPLRVINYVSAVFRKTKHAVTLIFGAQFQYI